jgi:hypothetical protein
MLDIPASENLAIGPADQPANYVVSEAAATRQKVLNNRGGVGLLGSLLGEERLQPYLPKMQPNDYKQNSTGSPAELAIRLMLLAYIVPISCNLSPYEIHSGPDPDVGFLVELHFEAHRMLCKLQIIR